jgi:outer membrane protein OmpA-like peptidoglycan-associated protein
MAFTIKVAAALASALTASACISWPMSASRARPECASQTYIIYYNYHEEDLRVSTQPMIRHITEQVATCQKAGGQLKSVTIVGFPNRADNSAAGDETAVARGQAVLDALVAAGVPTQQIKLADYRLEPDDLKQPMRRRAEIAVEMR